MVKNEVFGDFPPYQRLICVPKRAFFRLGGRPSAQTPPGKPPPGGTPPEGGVPPPGGVTPPGGYPPGGGPPGGAKTPKNLEIALYSIDRKRILFIFYFSNNFVLLNLKNIIYCV